jgi:glycosyltransferase involved in cell wall biosynthesis
MPAPKLKVVFCCPVLERPTDALIQAIEASVPFLTDYDHQMVFEVGCPYISSARATMLRKALDAKADIIVFLDYDLSFPPDALVKLIETEGEVVCGTYRFKADEEKYMGRLAEDERGRPIVREDGCVKADWIPAGFLKVTATAIDAFMGAYPELCFGPRYAPSVDLFNHGAHEGVWWGEDYAFSRRWKELGGEIWTIPDLDLTHHSKDKAFPGNYRKFLLKLSDKIRASEKAAEAVS